MPVRNVAKTATAFESFAAEVRRSGRTLTEAEAKKAAKQFAVPLDDVLALREEMLSRANAAGDDVAGKTRSMRAETSSGTPVGSPKAQGPASAPLARFADVKTRLRALPSFIDAGSARVLWGVHVGNDKASSATAILEDDKKNQIHLSVPVAGDAREPTIGFMKRGATGEVAMHPVEADLASTLLVLLDATLANSPRPSTQGSGPAYGAAVAQALLDHCERLLASKNPRNIGDEQALIDRAATAFDGGRYGEAVDDLKRTATSSAYSAVRRDAYLVLGEMQHRLGKNEEALASLRLALPRMTAGGRVSVLSSMAKIHNALRQFDKGRQAGMQAVAEGEAINRAGGEVKLSGTYFTVGVAEKNLGHIDHAIDSMKKALDERPDAVFIQLALAGYLGMAGKKAEAQAMFDGISVPPPNEMAFIDYNTNGAWFYAVTKDKAKVLELAGLALEAARRFNHPATLHYFKAEPDLDWLRGDADFQKLLQS